MTPTGTKKKLTLLLSLIVFLFIAAVAIKYRSALFQTLLLTDMKWLTAGLGCYFANYLGRAYRIRSYLHNQLHLFPDTLRITCLHGFASYFLPMRSGDLTLPVLLRFYHGIPIARGSRILLRARLLDILSLGLLLIGATTCSAPRLDKPWLVLFIVTGLVLIGAPYLLIALTRWKKGWLLERLKWLESGKENETKYPTWKELLQSLIIWFWTGCTTFCVIRSLDITLNFMDVWFFAAIQLPLQLLPIQGLANSGNHEAGWLAALKLLGIEPTSSLSVTLASHILLIGYVTTLGLFVLILPAGRSSFNNRLLPRNR